VINPALHDTKSIWSPHTMSAPAPNGPMKWGRNSPFTRASPSPSPVVTSGSNRPVSAIMSSPVSSPPGHARHQSFSPLGSLQQVPGRTGSVRKRSNSYRSGSPATGTFAPTFIKSDDIQKPLPKIDGIEGENDFSGKKYVWLKDIKTAFVRGWVAEELGNGSLLVQCDDGSVRLNRTR